MSMDCLVSISLRRLLRAVIVTRFQRYTQGEIWGINRLAKECVNSGSFALTHMGRSDWEGISPAQADRFAGQFSRSITRNMTQCLSNVCPSRWDNPNFQSGYANGYWNAQWGSEALLALATCGGGSAAKASGTIIGRSAALLERNGLITQTLESNASKVFKMNRFNQTVCVSSKSWTELINPFSGKSFQQIDQLLRSKGFSTRGPDPLYGKGSYFRPVTNRKYYFDYAGKIYRGDVKELPHVDVHYKIPVNNMEKQRFPLRENLYE